MYIKDLNELGYICSHWPLRPDIPTLLFVHGAGLNHAQWQAQMLNLRNQANLIAVDLPGHALSAHHEGEQSISAYAGILAELIEHLACKELILVGHSMGGAACIELAIQQQQCLAGLILINTGAKLSVSPELLEKISDDFPHFVQMMAEQAMTDGADIEILQPFTDLLLQSDLQVVVNDFSACNQFDRLEQLNTVTCPTLVLSAELDTMTPPKYGQFLSDHLTNSHFEIIHGAAHLSPMEHPEEINNAIQRFLQSV